MKISPVTKTQLLKVGKVALYAGASAGIAALVSAIAANPALFGPLTPIVNILLVFIKQAFTEGK